MPDHVHTWQHTRHGTTRRREPKQDLTQSHPPLPRPLLPHPLCFSLSLPSSEFLFLLVTTYPRSCTTSLHPFPSSSLPLLPLSSSSFSHIRPSIFLPLFFLFSLLLPAFPRYPSLSPLF